MITYKLLSRIALGLSLAFAPVIDVEASPFAQNQQTRDEAYQQVSSTWLLLAEYCGQQHPNNMDDAVHCFSVETGTYAAEALAKARELQQENEQLQHKLDLVTNTY